MSDWNTGIIEEFRAHEGVVGGPFTGVPMLLLHHVGRKSGTERVSPLAYLPGDDDSTVYIFASKAGAPTNPDWYYNLTAAGAARIERGRQTFEVSVAELTGDERDAVFAEQARRLPAFAGYAEKTDGVRVIPVLKLTRVA